MLEHIMSKLPRKILSTVTKDVEFLPRYWIESLLIAIGLFSSVVVSLSLFILLSYDLITVVMGIVLGIFAGGLSSLLFLDRIEKRYLLIVFLFVVIFGATSILIVDVEYPLPVLHSVQTFTCYLVIYSCISMQAINFLGILFKTTGILERGRVIAVLIVAILGVIPFGYFSLSLPGINYFLNLAGMAAAGVLLFRGVHKEEIANANVPTKELFSSKIIKYLVILTGIAFIEGFTYPARMFYVDLTNPAAMILYLPVLVFFLPALAGILLLSGIVFDLHGRRRSLSVLVVFLGLHIVFTFLEHTLNLPVLPIGDIGDISIADFPYLSISSFFTAVCLSIIAFLVIVGDITPSTTKLFPVFALAIASSAFGGILLRNLFPETDFFIHFPFYVGAFGLLLISTVLANTTDTLPRVEQEWNKSIVSLYVMHDSGILLYHEDFVKGKAKLEAQDEGDGGIEVTMDGGGSDVPGGEMDGDDEAVHDLVSSGLVGVTQLMQEILKGKKIVRSIDHYTKKVIMEAGDHTIVALIALQDLRVLREKVGSFIKEFEAKHKDSLEKTVIRPSDFDGVEKIAQKYFNVKYLDVRRIIEENLEEIGSVLDLDLNVDLHNLDLKGVVSKYIGEIKELVLPKGKPKEAEIEEDEPKQITRPVKKKGD